MYCGQCGTEIPSQAKFCGGCGSPVSGSPRTSISETLDRLRGNSNTNRFGTSLSRTAAVNNDVHADEDVRCLFVVGAAQTEQAVNWLLAKYPSSQVIRFSSIVAVREAAQKMARSGSISSLCLIGTTQSVPQYRISLGDTIGKFEYGELESDLFYCTDKLAVTTIPKPNEKSTRAQFYRELFLRLGAGEVTELIPVGRIPLDEFQSWRRYLESLDTSIAPQSPDYVAIASQEDHWRDECLSVHRHLKKDGKIFVVPQDWDELITNLDKKGFSIGARIQVNLHGGEPTGSTSGSSPVSKENQTFSCKTPRAYFDLSDTKPYPENILFLYACYGGNSGWWHTGFIPHFFDGGGRAVVAASTSVWVSDTSSTELEPGAIEICGEFYAAIESGLSVGEALCYAKSKTLADSLTMFNGLYFCKALKEVLQFSLFGAPWFTPGRKASSVVNKTEPKSTSSILDSVRSASRISRNPANASGVLSRVRERLHRSLGSGAEYFTLSRQSVIEAYRSAGALENISNSVRSAGFEFESSSFESLVVNGKEFQIAISPSNNKDSSDQLMVVIDAEGQILKTFQTKG